MEVTATGFFQTYPEPLASGGQEDVSLVSYRCSSLALPGFMVYAALPLVGRNLTLYLQLRVILVSCAYTIQGHWQTHCDATLVGVM